MNKTTLSFTLSISALFLGVILMATFAGNKPINQEEQSSIHNVYVTQQQDMIPTTPTPIPGYNSDTKGISSGTPTPVYIVSIDTPTPTPSCLPSDTNCDGIVDDLTADYDGDGYKDWYDPNPRVCDPCLKPNQWMIDIYVEGSYHGSRYSVEACDTNPLLYLEYWPYYKFDRGDGNIVEINNVCNYPANCQSNSVNWLISGTEGTDYAKYQNPYQYEDNWTIVTQFYKDGMYSITAQQGAWTAGNCNPITKIGCLTQVTSGQAGTASALINVSASIRNKSRTVSKNSALTGVTDSLVDSFFNSGSNELMKDTDTFSIFDYPSVYDDTVCCVKLIRANTIDSGPAKIADANLDEISSWTEWITLLNYGYKVNIVSSFSYPDDFTLGLSSIGADHITAVFDAKVIYHENGHTKYLPDLGNTSQTPVPDPWDENLMRAKMSVSGWETNSNQAAAIQNGN